MRLFHMDCRKNICLNAIPLSQLARFYNCLFGDGSGDIFDLYSRQ